MTLKNIGNYVLRRQIAHAVSDELFRQRLRAVRENSNFDNTAGFMQHGTTTRYLHSVAVAYFSFRIALTLGMKAHASELIRASLLHDFFLYNSKTDDDENKGHMLHHPYDALRRAKRYFPLTKKEEDIIRSHMFPLSLTAPKHKESYIVCFVDKLCAIYEFFIRKNPYPIVNFNFAKDKRSGKRDYQPEMEMQI